MRAVCDFTRVSRLEAQGDSFDYSSCFLPLMGKPFIQHVLEYIERLGIREWDVYLSNAADEMEEFIGDGERWGVKLTYHLLKEATDVAQRISRDLKLLGEESFLLCNDFSFPLLAAGDLSSMQRFVTPQGVDTQWRVCSVSTLESELPAREVPSLGVRSAKEYLQSLKQVHRSKGEGLIVFGKELREGIWVGPGTKVPLSCTLVAPVHLGSHVRLGEQSIIGPFAEIGNGCIIGEGTLVQESTILEGSFLGMSLDVRGCIVKENKILNAQLEAVYQATDEMLFASVESLEDRLTQVPVPFFSRLLALFLGLATSPILLLLLLWSSLFSRGALRQTVVIFPQQSSPSKVRTRSMWTLKSRAQTSGCAWKHLLWHLIPGLWLVVAKRARFFGIPYKSLEEFQTLSKEWQALYLRSIPGLIAEADIVYEEYPEDQMLFASEMFSSVMDSPKRNMHLLGGYLRRLFTGKSA